MNRTSPRFAPGLPRRRLGQPLLCPLSGRMITGERCLQSCGYAHEDHGFCDCLQDELAIGRNPRPEDRAGAKVVAGVNQ